MLQDATRRRVELHESGIEIALLDFGGEGPTVLLHHANGFCAATWAPVALALRGEFRVVAMDARGHGDSSAPEDPEAYAWPRLVEDLTAVTDALSPGGGPIPLGVGHSFGGTVLLAAAARRPELFEQILLLDPVVHPPSSADTEPVQRARIAALIERARKRRAQWPSLEDARRHFEGREFFGSWDDRVLRLYAEEGLRERPRGGVELKCAPEVEAAVFERGGTLDLFDAARGAQIPALLSRAVRGDFPRAVFEALAALLPNARVEDVDAGHLIPMERPDLVVELIRRAGRKPPG